MTSLPFAPTEYVILTEGQARKKCNAISCYGAEMTAGRSVADVERQLKYRGAEVGAEYAEAFVVARRFG